MLAKASESTRQLEILSTHPNPKRRMKTVRKLLEGKYAFTQGNPDYKTRAGRFVRDAGPHLGE